MDWDEACGYFWGGPMTGRIYEYMVDDGYVWCRLLGEEDWERWSRVEHITPSSDLFAFRYKQLGKNPNATPTLTPQEKVLKKIALMEQRWLAFQDIKRLQDRKAQHG